MLLRPREIILMAIFTAFAVAGGLVMVQFPNVELVTVSIFLSGMMLGAWRGASVGAVAEFLYSFFNPYGVAAPPLLAAQMISMVFVGAAGGFVRSFFRQRLPPIWLLGLLGLALTFVFDLLTTLSFTVVAGLGLKGFFAAVSFGFYFYLLHQASNVLIFAFVLPILLRHLRQLSVFHETLSATNVLQRPDPRPLIRVQAENKS